MMTSLDRALRRDLWIRLSRLRRLRRVQTAMTLGLVFLGPVLVVATFLALGPLNQGGRSPSLRLILLNIGGALPGEMDKATQGQPAKYTFCCAENVDASPWEPLQVERGFGADASTVTVVGALGTWSMNMTARRAGEVLAMIADTMQYPASSDYMYGGAPFILLSPQHANLFHREGWSKADVKRRLWQASKIRAGRSKGSEFERMANGRRAELGEERQNFESRIEFDAVERDYVYLAGEVRQQRVPLLDLVVGALAHALGDVVALEDDHAGDL